MWPKGVAEPHPRFLFFIFLYIYIKEIIKIIIKKMITTLALNCIMGTCVLHARRHL
jgi:hypothetical protein